MVPYLNLHPYSFKGAPVHLSLGLKRVTALEMK
jgi:hypothetical protein